MATKHRGKAAQAAWASKQGEKLTRARENYKPDAAIREAEADEAWVLEQASTNPEEFTALACIVTKYHGPTNTLGSRVSARRGDHRPGDKVAWTSYDHEYSGVQAHARAALKLLDLLGLDWELSHNAAFTNESYIFTVSGFNR